MGILTKMHHQYYVESGVAPTPADPVFDDLLSYWRFEDNSNDAKGSNDGTDTTISYVTGKENKAADFTTRGTSHIDYGDVLDFDYDEPFTWNLWVKKDSGTGYNEILYCKRANASPYNGYLVYIKSDGGFEWQLTNNNASNALVVSSTANVTDTNWHMVTFTYDGSATPAGVKLYKDGVLQSWTTTHKNTLSATTLTSFPLELGAIGSTGLPFQGLMDEVGVWNRDLSQAEITELYNSSTGKFY